MSVPAIPLGHALVGKQDLPIPEWLFAWGASVVLIVSFVVLTVAWRTPRLQEEGWRPWPRLSAVLLSPVVTVLAGAIGVALLVAVVYSGLEGTEAPDRNFSVTFVLVTFWLGVPVLSALLGDFFRAFNPWRAIARVFAAGFRAVAGQSPPPPLSYPERLGHWPAVAGIVAFAWLELVYEAGGVSLSPEPVAVATLLYSAITFIGMALFGIDRWCKRGEAFSVYFGMFARLSPVEAREGRLGVRRPLSGAPGWGQVPGSVALVLVAIGATSFDGAQEGALEGAIGSTIDWLRDLGMATVGAFRLADTLWLAVVMLGVAAVFAIGVRGMRTVGDRGSAGELGRAFAHSLIPIALAYLVAHYFSLVVFQEQAQFTYLLSDPLGDGSDLFGTASGGIDYGLIGATLTWYVQVGALVVGHVVALTLAHDRAMALYRDPKVAARSQYWMLAVMVGFTCFGLYLLSQANA